MAIDLKQLLASRGDQVYRLHEETVNPQFVKVLRTIGFDRGYTRAAGPYLYGPNGEEYLDLLSGYGVFNIGRNHPDVRRALVACMELELPNLVQMDCARLCAFLAEALLQRAPARLRKVFFTNSGTEAVEGAIKFVRAATGRPAILYLDHAFHGLSTGSLALNGNREFREGFGDLLPHTRAIPLGDLEALEAELEKGDVAALVAEPIQGKGVYLPPDGYFEAAQELLRRHGALLVLDEVQTGLGRTGAFFALEHWGLEPDVVTVAKALSGGWIPVGAILMTDAVCAATFSRMDRCVVHSSTFAQNDLAMAAGLATLEVIDREGLVERARTLGDRLLGQLEALKSRHPVIREVRGKGLMVGIEFGPPDGFLSRMKWKLMDRIERGLFTQVIAMHLLGRHRILTQVAGHHVEILKLLPPLVVSEQDLDRFVEALDQTLSESRMSRAMLEMGRNLGRHALRGR